MSIIRKAAGCGLSAAAAATLLAFAAGMPAQAQPGTDAPHQWSYVDSSPLSPELDAQVSIACEIKGKERISKLYWVTAGKGNGRRHPLAFPECSGAGTLQVQAMLFQDDSGPAIIACNEHLGDLPSRPASFTISFASLAGGKEPHCWMKLEQRP